MHNPQTIFKSKSSNFWLGICTKKSHIDLECINAFTIATRVYALKWSLTWALNCITSSACKGDDVTVGVKILVLRMTLLTSCSLLEKNLALLNGFLSLNHWQFGAREIKDVINTGCSILRVRYMIYRARLKIYPRLENSYINICLNTYIKRTPVLPQLSRCLVFLILLSFPYTHR